MKVTAERLPYRSEPDCASIGEVHYRVLGPVAVLSGTEPVELGGRRQRMVLALLLANANKTVSQEQLVHAVWAGHPPDTGARTLQSYIAHLRRALSGAIDRQGEGYALNTAADRIDAVRFRALVDEARAVVANDSESASKLLHSALDLWTGPPYGDLGYEEALVGEANRLREERLVAEELRLEADLDYGLNGELLADIEALLAEHPHREGLMLANMLALYRSGRHVEALAAYEKHREALVEEFGTSPSRRLQRLNLQILNRDPELDPRPQVQRPRLPARYSSFVGRDAEIDQVLDAMSMSRLVTITGPGGIGKTSLAVAACKHSDLPSAVLVDFEKVGSTDVTAHLALSIGVDPRSTLDAIAASLAKDLPVVVLDGCENVVWELSPLVDDLLKRVPSLQILVTSREPLFLRGELVLYLNPLATGTRSPSTQLFLDRLGRPPVGTDELETIDAIGERLDGVPLAIELAASRGRRMSLSQIAERLDDQVSLLAEVRGSSDRRASIRATLDWSYDLLDEEQRSLFRELSLFRSEFTMEEAVSATGSDADLLDLVDVSVVSPASPDGTYRLLEPVRQYAYEELVALGELEASRKRQAEWLIQVAAHSLHDVFDWSRWKTTRFQLRRRSAEFVDAMEWSLNSSDGTEAVRLTAEVAGPLSSVADIGVFRDLAIQSVEARVDVSVDVLARAYGMCAFAFGAEWSRDGDADTFFELLAEAERLLQDTDDHLAWFVVRCVGALRTPHPSLDRGGLEDSLRLWHEAHSHGVAAGVISDGPTLNGASINLGLGRWGEAVRFVEKCSDGGGEVDPSALALGAFVELRRGNLGLAAERAEQALVNLLEPDPAASLVSHVLTCRAVYLEDWPEAERQISLGADFVGAGGFAHWTTETTLLMRIAMARGDWTLVGGLLSDWCSALPLQPRFSFEDEQVVLVWYTAARWLASGDEIDLAARMAADADHLMELAPSTAWEAIGERRRWKEFAATLPAAEPSNMSLVDARRFLRWLVAEE